MNAGLSTSITSVENITVSFDMLRLLGNPIKHHRAFDDNGATFTRQLRYLERTYSLGMRFRF